MSNTQLTISTFKTTLDRYKPDIVGLLRGVNMTPEKFMMTAINAVKKNPVLLECTPESLFGAIFISAELGLPPNTHHGFSFIIPYNNNKGDSKNPRWVKEAQLQIGYQGAQEIVYRHPEVMTITSEIIRENEFFEETKGSDSKIVHKPVKYNQEPGRRIGAYCIIKLANGGEIRSVLWEKEIMQFKALAKNNSKAWDENNDPAGWMWMKAAIKQACKKAPKTGGDQVERMLQYDNAYESGKSILLGNDKNILIDETAYKQAQSQENNQEKSESVTNETLKAIQGG